MCHGAPVRAFPTPVEPHVFDESVAGYVFGDARAKNRVAILPDIYGCNAFYRGLATHLAEKGAGVFLVDTFHGLGELSENTREVAFERRNKVKDKNFLDHFETFIDDRGVTGVIGFCLGGLYVFELARRRVEPDLVGLYGFPQGLPNQDELPTPFDYLTSIEKPFTMLMGEDDASVGAENTAKLVTIDKDAPAMTLKMYKGVGHGFLPLLDSENSVEREVAEDALSYCEALAT